MNLKELIKEVEELKKEIKEHDGTGAKYGLKKIKQTVEAIAELKMFNKYGTKVSFYTSVGEFEDWQTLKKLLGVK